MAGDPAEKYQTSLQNLSDTVLLFLDAFDGELEVIFTTDESRHAKGKRLAAMANKLDMANDYARLFLGLNLDKVAAVRAIKKARRAGERSVR